MKKVMRTAFGMLTVSAIYFAFILYVNNYICTPALGQQWSGVVSLALILAPVALYEINEKMS